MKLHVWIPHGKIADAYFLFSLNYLPLLNYGPLTNKGMKFCKCRISKSFIARNLKLVMLIGRVGRSKPPPVLTGGFNRLKPPWSILPKVVNSGQY